MTRMKERGIVIRDVSSDDEFQPRHAKTRKVYDNYCLPLRSMIAGCPEMAEIRQHFGACPISQCDLS